MDIYKFFFKNNSSPLLYKNITAFEGTLSSVFPSPQNAFCFTNLSLLVLEIFKFFEYHAQNLNTPQKQMGFNPAFKGLNIATILLAVLWCLMPSVGIVIC